MQAIAEWCVGPPLVGGPFLQWTVARRDEMGPDGYGKKTVALSLAM